MKYSNLTASIPEELKEEVKERAKSEDLTISDIVMVALAKFLTNSDDDRNSKKSHTYIVGGSQSPSKSLKITAKINKKRVKHIALISNPLYFPQITRINLIIFQYSAIFYYIELLIFKRY